MVDLIFPINVIYPVLSIDFPKPQATSPLKRRDSIGVGGKRKRLKRRVVKKN